MSVAIRLARGGAKKRPYYRIVVTNSRSARDGRFIEKIGTYNPLLAKDSPDRVKLDAERAKHWISVGAQPSDRVLRFLDAAGVMERGFGPAQDRVDAGDLPFAANLVHGLADAQPVVEGRVRGVHHHLVLLDGPCGLFQQAPDHVEETLGELSLGVFVEQGIVVGDRHGTAQSMTARTWPVSTT